MCNVKYRATVLPYVDSFSFIFYFKTSLRPRRASFYPFSLKGKIEEKTESNQTLSSLQIAV